MTDKWLPMKSAPKDTTRVLLVGTLLTYCTSLNDQGKPFTTTVDIGIRRFNRWWVGVYECKPTHWMPLPKPPNLEVTKGD